MLVNRTKIEKDVAAILQAVNAKRKVKDLLISKFEDRGFLYGEINSIISGTNPVMQLRDELLCLFV
jgi:hypothetical protein